MIRNVFVMSVNFVITWDKCIECELIKFVNLIVNIEEYCMEFYFS